MAFLKGSADAEESLELTLAFVDAVEELGAGRFKSLVEEVGAFAALVRRGMAPWSATRPDDAAGVALMLSGAGVGL